MIVAFDSVAEAAFRRAPWMRETGRSTFATSSASRAPLCAGGDQRFQDRRVVDVGVVIDGGPEDIVQDCPSPSVFDFQRRVLLQKQFDRIEVARQSCKMEGRLSVPISGYSRRALPFPRTGCIPEDALRSIHNPATGRRRECR